MELSKLLLRSFVFQRSFPVNTLALPVCPCLTAHLPACLPALSACLCSPNARLLISGRTKALARRGIIARHPASDDAEKQFADRWRPSLARGRSQATLAGTEPIPPHPDGPQLCSVRSTTPPPSRPWSMALQPGPSPGSRTSSSSLAGGPRRPRERKKKITETLASKLPSAAAGGKESTGERRNNVISWVERQRARYDRLRGPIFPGPGHLGADSKAERPTNAQPDPLPPRASTMDHDGLPPVWSPLCCSVATQSPARADHILSAPNPRICACPSIQNLSCRIAALLCPLPPAQARLRRRDGKERVQTDTDESQ